MLAHLSGNVRDDFVPVFQLNLKGGIRHRINNGAFHFNVFFFRHDGIKPRKNSRRGVYARSDQGSNPYIGCFGVINV